MIMDDIRKRLMTLSEPEYKAFALKLLPKGTVMYGVRLPLIKKIAKNAAKEQSLDFLDEADSGIFEEKMFCAFVIGYAKLPIQEKLVLISRFIPRIDNWSICDSFCAALHIKNSEEEAVFEFLQPFLKSSEEFPARFGIVMLLDYFVKDENIDRVLKLIKDVKCGDYYAQMAAAWAISVCMACFPEKTIRLFEERALCTFVHNKAIQKTCESRRINIGTKKYIKTLKIGGKK